MALLSYFKNELSTQVDLEQRRQQLLDLEGENARKQAEFAAEALRIQLRPYQSLDAHLLLALAFRDFAANAHKIGNPTITSEILERLLNPRCPIKRIVPNFLWSKSNLVGGNQWWISMHRLKK